MSARKYIRAITRTDSEAVLTAEDDAVLVDALDKRYLRVDRMLPKTDDRIRKRVATPSAAGRRRSGKTGAQ